VNRLPISARLKPLFLHAGARSFSTPSGCTSFEMGKPAALTHGVPVAEPMLA
jgi:hypothetical protein